MALNLTSEQYAKLRAQAMALGVNLHRPGIGATNRRVYFLGVNHRNTYLADVKLRRALAHAIDREKLLDECFRAGLPRAETHKAINSPYPAHSWPCDPTVKVRTNADTLDPFDKALAQAQAGLLGPRTEHGAPDTEVSQRQSGCRQGHEGPLRAGARSPRPRSARSGRGRPLAAAEGCRGNAELRPRLLFLRFPGRYPLLKPLLSRPFRAGKENPFAYKGDLSLLDKITAQRDPRQVKEFAQQFHAMLYREMPLIPLWQLDPFHAFSAAVRAPNYDPHLVFTDSEEWSLER